MTITRYSPWHVHGGHLHDEIRNVFDRFLNGEETDQSNVVTSQWTPHVDIKEEDSRFVILADIPGVDPKDIEITMEKGILSIKGERKSESTEQNGKLTRTERSHGLFYRRFALPDSADAEGIKAAGKNGVLEVSIPKRPETAPRRINVN
jgi:HSP20 family protein